ncbi:MAG: cytochrome c biogenesis heme-transporting ATPase CcmA [Gammaproteobacteria bacterium]|nr:cytochrome c biogenesis heme-transporting ATPase CcmA [Gammaproteobacteria bacterium]
MPEAMFSVRALSCARGDRVLFGGVSFELHAGEALHIRGPNGHGKTTLLRALCGLGRPLRGDIRWRGERVRDLGDEFYAVLAYLGHLNGLRDELTAAENVWTYARIHGGADCDGKTVRAALARVGLAAAAGRPARHMSQGQKRRLALACLLVVDRPLWLLDEPFTALDVASVGALVSLIEEHLHGGGVALIVSHQAFDLPGIRAFDLEHFVRVKR